MKAEATHDANARPPDVPIPGETPCDSWSSSRPPRIPRPASCPTRSCSPRWAPTTRSWSRPASCRPAKGCTRARRARASGSPARKRTVIDGPFAETKELIAGFWIWKVKSKEEAIEWVKRCPNPMPGDSEIEIRQVFEAEDFGAEFTPGAARAGRAPARGDRRARQVTPSRHRQRRRHESPVLPVLQRPLRRGDRVLQARRRARPTST